MSNWTPAPQPFGPNHAPLLEGLSSVDGVTPVPVAVNPADGSLLASVISGGGGGTQYVEGSTTSPATGTLALARYQLTPPSLTDGQMWEPQLDSSGNLKVTGSLSVGGTTDNSSFTAGTSTGTPAMGFYHSTIDAVTDGRAAAVAITTNRAQHVNLRNNSGTEIGTSATPVQVSLANTGANSTAVKVDGTGGTFPATQSGTWNITNISGTISLPTGAATSAKQPALGTAGTASADVITVQGIASMTPLQVSQATAASLNATVVGTGTFAVQSTPVAPSSVFNGKTSVTTAGTRVVLASSQAVKSVAIKALTANTGTIYVGSSTVSSANGFQLAAGDTISLDIANLNTVNLDSSVNGEGVTYVGTN